MIEDRRLLQRAWPTMLVERGLETAGGYLCLGRIHIASGALDEPYYLEGGDGLAAELIPGACLEDNGLLPKVDPDAAPGTWAVLLRDLAVASGAIILPGSVLHWSRWEDTDGPAWILAVLPCTRSEEQVEMIGSGFLEVYSERAVWFDTGKWDPVQGNQQPTVIVAPDVVAETDPARALVLARIHLRERATS